MAMPGELYMIPGIPTICRVGLIQGKCLISYTFSLSHNLCLVSDCYLLVIKPEPCMFQKDSLQPIILNKVDNDNKYLIL